jgi:hypothetical protein
MLWQEAIGWPVVLFAIVGAIALAAAGVKRLFLLVAFPIAFLLFISNTVPASRYLNPLLPFVAMLAAYGMTRLVHLVVSAFRRTDGGGPSGPSVRLEPATTGITLVVFSVAAATPGLVGSVASDRFFRQTDTRTLALGYLESHVPSGTTVLVQPYSVPLAQSTDSLREALARHLGNPEQASIKFQLRLAAGNPRGPSYRTIFLGDGGLDVDKIYVSYDDVGGPRGLAALRALRVAYVILTRYNDPEPRTLPFLEALEREGRRIAVFSPYRSDDRGPPRADVARRGGGGPDVASRIAPYLHNTDARIDPRLERPGPVIELWRLNDTAP